jgi:hypothetical protein
MILPLVMFTPIIKPVTPLYLQPVKMQKTGTQTLGECHEVI